MPIGPTRHRVGQSRQQLQVEIITLLAEMRVALTVWRSSAFVLVTFNGPA